jgi:2-iminobutanoate/2-iminopropanoate deaminase
MSTVRSNHTGGRWRLRRHAEEMLIPSGIDQVVVSGTLGVCPGGVLPHEFAEEARQVWRNVDEALECAGAKISDIVAVRSWLTNADDLDTYVGVLNECISISQPL